LTFARIVPILPLETDEQNRPNHCQPAKSRKLPARRLVCLRQYAQAESKAGGANLK
jgi:hypothetical protein